MYTGYRVTRREIQAFVAVFSVITLSAASIAYLLTDVLQVSAVIAAPIGAGAALCILWAGVIIASREPE